jgi:hypothetical protein
MANAAIAHFGLDPGRFVQWMGGEYTGQHQDAHSTLAAVQGHVLANDYAHMKRILLDSCPAQLKFEEPLSNKIEMIECGNSKSFNDNTNLVLKTMNKEDRYSHLIPLDEIMCRFLSSYCRHTTQTMVIKAGKSDRLCWDGSTTIKSTDIIMNQVTLITREAPITFGHVKMQMYIDIYNTRITYPTFIILLAMADVKACFCFPCIHADLTGAFGFLARGYFNLATAMVLFGSTASALSWEPFWHAIQALSVVYVHHHDVIKKHRKFLDMISWAPLDPAPDLARAIPCTINTGVLANQGNRVLLPARIYVNNALTLAISKENMEQVLAALIKAIFVVMGVPDTSICQCSLAMDKWEKLRIAPIQTMLGLLINTNRMILSIPDDYIQGVCLLIESPRHTHCQRFTVKKAQELTGKLGHLAKGANWVFHLLTHLYASIAYALLENKKILADFSPEFQKLIKSLWSGYFSATSRTKSPTSFLPSSGLQNWYINHSVSTTSQSQCTKK